jgi:beta-glucanase (GH16 family)
LNAQNVVLVWEDEFNENTIDLSNWDYDTGSSNDNVHYYTSRNENVQIVNGVLNIIALEESYQGYNYTSGLIKTKINWRYGRVEARIKLPATNGFVPAFWMLPADNIYGWWPKSGEIDIMEHPTNEVSNIYGSIHTETYNNFGGIGNEGDVTEITDAASEFHIYAIDWTKDKIDFYVDNNLYYTFNNAHSGSAEWPFDRPFYIILNLAVGGGWVGDPDETSVFPARMEVDWVRVYQYFDDMAIQGADFIPYNSSDITYSIPDINGAETSWELPGNAEISIGQNTNQIKVDWNYFGGDIKVNVTTNDGSRIITYPVKVSENLLKNSGFEKGVKYWNELVGYPASAAFNLSTAGVFYGNQALSVDVQTLGTNPWDIQISQKELFLKSGQQYHLSFWAKSDHVNGEINLALINSEFFVYHSERFELSNNWEQYKIDYTAATNDMVNLNIDLGIKTGVYYFDQFLLTTPEFSDVNQIRNADFFESDSGWNFVTHGSAQANSTVINGEYRVSIVNGGNDGWDIHLGQFPLNIENGKKYTITFDAYAASPRTILALVGMNAEPWTLYSGDQIISLTTEKQTYSYSFIMSDPSDNQSRFGFDLGGFAIDVFFDNLIVSSGTTVVGMSKIPNTPQRIQLVQNYPNPFNPTTNITYHLPKSSNVELSIYNLVGQKVAILVSERQQVGQHQVQWDASGFASGIYYYMIKTDEFRQVKKMVLVR